MDDRRYAMAYATYIDNTKLNRVVEYWKIFDRESEECRRSKPVHSYEIRVFHEEIDTPYHVYLFKPSESDYIHVARYSSLEIAIKQCITRKERTMLLDDVVELCWI